MIKALTNEEWATIIYDMSEDGANIQAPCLVSNERGYHAAISRAVAVAGQGGAYIGIGPEQNWTYIGAFRPSIAVILDTSREILLLHILYMCLLDMSGSASAFLTALFGRPCETDIDASHPLGTIDEGIVRRVRAELRRRVGALNAHWLTDHAMRGILAIHEIFVRRGPTITQATARSQVVTWPQPTFLDLARSRDEDGERWSFIARPESFAYVKALVGKRLILPVVGSVEGGHALKGIAQFLRLQKTDVRIFYVSNIDLWIAERGREEAWLANLATLPVTGRAVLLRWGVGESVVPIRDVVEQRWRPPTRLDIVDRHV